MIELWAISFTLVLARVGTFVATMPLFGGRGLPRMVKMGLAFALVGVWLGQVKSSLELAAVSLGAQPISYAIALGREMVLGAVLGFAFGLLLLPAQIAGAFVGQEMGLTLASITDPSGQNRSNVMGQVFELMAILMFFGLDMHHVLIGVLDSTFVHWPIAGTGWPVPAGAVIDGLSVAHQWGLLLAAPVAACLFLTAIMLALLARAAPQLNLLTIGFALRVGVGLVATLLFMPELGLAMGGIFQHILGWIGQFV